jgi:RNA polymerase primary sigma factor
MRYGNASAPLLTKDDERALGSRLAAGRAARARLEEGRAEPGDEQLVAAAAAARKRFIESNLRLVLTIANRMRVPPHLDREDLVQDGMLGLERAVEKFDHTKGFKFSTYATWWIRQSMQRGLEHSATAIRIPEHRTTELRSAQRRRDEVGESLSDEMLQVEMLQQIDSLDREIDDTATPLGALVSGDEADPGDEALRAILADDVEALLCALDPTLAALIARRFGLRGHSPTTYTRIAEEFGLGEETVRRRVTRALERLRPWADATAA